MLNGSKTAAAATRRLADFMLCYVVLTDGRMGGCADTGCGAFGDDGQWLIENEDVESGNLQETN